MQTRLPLLSFLLATVACSAVEVDVEAFGESLGGWDSKRSKAAEYEISGANYRTYKPEVSPSPDGGIFVSLRIDHMRGLLASDDHASLEMSFSPDGTLVTAQSSIALQGHTITSELIRGGAAATNTVSAPYVDKAVKIGSDLVADLSSKLLREKIVEPGRVSYPAAIRHNYNLLYQAATKKSIAVPEPTVEPKPEAGSPPADPAKPVPTPEPPAKPIPAPEIKPYKPTTAPNTPLPPATAAPKK